MQLFSRKINKLLKTSNHLFKDWTLMAIYEFKYCLYFRSHDPLVRWQTWGWKASLWLLRVTCWSSGLLQFTHRYLKLLCVLFPVLMCRLKQAELSLCCLRFKSSSLLSLSSACYFKFPLSSVHIGGPQNAMFSLAGYLFINVVLLPMNMLIY